MKTGKKTKQLEKMEGKVNCWSADYAAERMHANLHANALNRPYAELAEIMKDPGSDAAKKLKAAHASVQETIGGYLETAHGSFGDVFVEGDYAMADK